MDEERQHKGGYAAPMWLALTPLLYILSIGPAAFLASKSPGQWSTTIRRAYYPVIWLHDHTPLRRPLELYVELWGVK